MTAIVEHKARKRHRCDWCWQFIFPGEQYKRYRYFQDSEEAGKVKMHPECCDAMLEEARQEGGWIEWTPGQDRPMPNVGGDRQ
jgi:hypothetical protein